jgi:hypothetical protein
MGEMKSERAKGKAINIPEDVQEPYEFLELLFTDTIPDGFVVNTNSYQRNYVDQKRWNNGINLTRNELKVYFAICLYMGIVRKPQKRMYWEMEGSLFSYPWVKPIMSRQRFEDITKFLHCYDTSSISADGNLL